MEEELEIELEPWELEEAERELGPRPPGCCGKGCCEWGQRRLRLLDQ